MINQGDANKILSIDGRSSVGGASISDCELLDHDQISPLHGISCTVSIQDTKKGQTLTIVAKKNIDGRWVSKTASYVGYLIDDEAPNLGSDIALEFNTNNELDKPRLTLKILPQDVG